MKKTLFLPLFALLLLACNGTSTQSVPESANTPENATAVSAGNETDKAQKWLIEAIEGHFNTDRFPQKNICTKTYDEYKTDAMGVDYDGGLTEEEFYAKWKGKYDTKYAGMGVAFLISAQDNGKIKVTKCEPIPKQDESAFYFKTLIEDLDFNLKYNRDIKVVRAADAYLIDDVLEYD